MVGQARVLMDSDSEDELPIAQRLTSKPAAPSAAAPHARPAGGQSAPAAAPGPGSQQPGTSRPAASMPALPAGAPAQLAKAAPPPAPRPAASNFMDEDAEVLPARSAAPASTSHPSTSTAAPSRASAPSGASAAPRPAAGTAPAAAPRANGAGPHRPAPGALDESDSEDDVPIGQRKLPVPAPGTRGPGGLVAAKSPLKRKPEANGAAPAKKVKREEPARKEKRPDKKKPAKSSSGSERKGKEEDNAIKWTTLSHHGVLFPPEYTPHGIKMLYEGKPVDLTPAQEEVATMFAVMKETEYMNKPQFLANFWAGFQPVLGKGHVIKSLDKCDFTPIYEWHMAEREKKRTLSKEEKDRVKKEKEAAEAKYKVAIVDGKQEQVGNFRVEPPGLFRGRGEHPKMGKIKKRIYPRDITINIGKGEPVPQHPYPGQTWAEVRHDRTVTWLAFWKDPVNSKEYKYVWLAANSSFKSESDLAKYEKARKLKDYIQDIRASYERDWRSKDVQKQQMATALYFIDKLALRAGHEKDEDEADTVGCCTLKVENVECIEPNKIKFDFLGKDSIRYENEVAVHDTVFKNLQKFVAETASGKKKKPEEQLFDTMDATDLNKRLKDLMDGLSVKVFRTYNASITLDRLLFEPSDSTTIDEKKADYDRANKEVAILCNHQRSVPKGHTGQMEKLQERMLALDEELHALQRELAAAEKGKSLEPGKKAPNPDAVRNKIQKKKAQIAKLDVTSRVKEDLKTVALGTSKINYLDPRITVAWCKRNEVPLEKVFNKSLLSKFNWSMDVEPEFKF